MNFSPKSIYNWYRDAIRNPKYRGWIVIGTLLYLISPIDLAPDLFPFVGQIDDVVVLTLFLTEISQMAIESFKQIRQSATAFDPNDTMESAEAAQPGNNSATIDVDAVSVE